MVKIKKIKKLGTVKKIKPSVLKPKPVKKTIKTPPKSKRSVIVHKSTKSTDNLFQILGNIENSIEELSRIYSELPDSKHYGIGGVLKPTLKQKVIEEQLRKAHARAQRIMTLIEK